ncbi:YcnI family protein [Marinobacterium rhizophilum]|uniref:YcnI family protein n=1 Tax=Marinobacterium rhizophilum TaxID=420402 RepID=A0ABY5HLK6_9GAMM|nr:DUF1775 domain-containing protein [Marinobacterium rhizophilum]UTW12137.1 YcnI family protein [Marinobacterium rhizophilum]
MKTGYSMALLALATVALTPNALAHASLETKAAPAGSHYKAVIRIGHGCDGAATHTLRVQLPPEMHQSKPMPKPGWELQRVQQKLDAPYDYDGQSVTEDARELVWSGGSLPDDYYDEFVFTTVLAGEIGQTLYVKAIQECDGAQVRWEQIPAEGQSSHDLAFPAPGVRLEGRAHHH